LKKFPRSAPTGIFLLASGESRLIRLKRKWDMRDYGLHYRKKRAAGRASARRIVNRAAHATSRADCERKITKDDSGRVRVRARPTRKIIILKAQPGTIRSIWFPPNGGPLSESFSQRHGRSSRAVSRFSALLELDLGD